MAVTLKEFAKSCLKKVGLGDVFTLRSKLASKYLAGTGLEIGAMHRPLRVPSKAKVRYVDIASREESIRKFPELDPRDIVEVDFVADGFTLEGIPSSNFDFLIANHVLEHSPDPIATLVHWHRVLKVSGILYCSVPIADKCFDKGRSISTYEHMLEDYREDIGRDATVARRRNRAHYLDWLTISLPAIDGRPAPAGKALERKIDELAKDSTEIHFHTFSSSSVRTLFEGVRRDVLPGLQLMEIADSGGEIIVIARKSPQ